jgi:cyclopropane fatty-acyl-phospholipid synthase-like methyltransferase
MTLEEARSTSRWASSAEPGMKLLDVGCGWGSTMMRGQATTSTSSA